ncbi:hypothetical protein HPB48_021686 [Haemaphysalis longicornis]|uniref:Phospholipase B-like n=1 Tax=Haemaphysalis longicornis TaxID=44386 RepID=A0A9J6FRJ9_HAELO|nr:hypothetical protein HPB48_021686 [Haemaphysalis longicornis]
MHYDNLWRQYCAEQADNCVQLFQFVGTTLDYMKEQAAKLADTDPYWHQVNGDAILRFEIATKANGVDIGAPPLN